MSRVAVILPLLAAGALAACSTLNHGPTAPNDQSQPQSSVTAPPPSDVNAQVPPAYRPGTGTVAAVREPSASAGGTAPGRENLVAMQIRMDDGTSQWVTVDTHGNTVPVGTRVEITQDRRIIPQ